MLREPHGPFTFSDNSRYFDIALMKSALQRIEAEGGRFDESSGCLIRYSPDILKDKRGYVRDYTDWLLREHNIHIEKDPISIAPLFPCGQWRDLGGSRLLYRGGGALCLRRRSRGHPWSRPPGRHGLRKLPGIRHFGSQVCLRSCWKESLFPCPSG